MSSSASGVAPSSSKNTSASYTHKTTYTGSLTKPTAMPTESIYNSGAVSTKSTLGSIAILVAGYMLLL